MPLHTWQQRTDQIMLREDEFSWQGAHPEDGGVFLRRSKDDPSQFTDLILGTLNESESQAVVTDFLVETGGLNETQIRVSSIGGVYDNHSETVATYDGIVAVMRGAISALGWSSPNARLERRGNKWDAVIDVRGQKLAN